MCFIIAGLQPKTRVISDDKRRCPRCGLHQAQMQQVDHYFSLFFIPLIPVKRGEPYLFCARCGQNTGADVNPPSFESHRQTECRHCGEGIESSFAYCPHCGRRQ